MSWTLAKSFVRSAPMTDMLDLSRWAISRHGPISFDYLIGDLVARCHIDSGIPRNRDAEGESEGRC